MYFHLEEIFETWRFSRSFLHILFENSIIMCYVAFLIRNMKKAIAKYANGPSESGPPDSANKSYVRTWRNARTRPWAINLQHDSREFEWRTSRLLIWKWQWIPLYELQRWMESTRFDLSSNFCIFVPLVTRNDFEIESDQFAVSQCNPFRMVTIPSFPT